MNTYRQITIFNYKNGKYQLLQDQNNKFFFLKVDVNGIYNYVTLEEFNELIKIVYRNVNIMRIKRDRKKPTFIKMIPKIIIGGIATILTLSTLNCCHKPTRDEALKQVENYKNKYGYEISIEEYDDKELSDVISVANEKDNTKTDTYEIVIPTDSDEEFKVDTYFENVFQSGTSPIYIYDMNYLDKALDYDKVGAKELHDAINNNPKIIPSYKKLFNDFVDDFCEKQPNAETRVLYENLKTIEVVECDKMELALASYSIDAYGCYRRNENKIYVLEGNEYKKGTWEYQVIYHELCHAARTLQKNINGRDVNVQCEGIEFSTTSSSEALNSLFTVSLFDYEDRDIAYQLQSNYFKVIIDNMDNYDIVDYMNHSSSYFVKKLDEWNHDNNYAKSILDLIEMQYKDFHNDDIELPQEQYYPIYDYISDMFLRKHVTSEMSYDEAKNQMDILLEQILFDVPEEYNIDTNHFYEYLDEYCNELGIEVTKLSR